MSQLTVVNPASVAPVEDVWKMAGAIAASGLFGMKSQNEAMALMLIAQAEGQHPAVAARDYHIVDGRPTLKADAMLARFMGAGGKVEWHSYTDEKVEATFSHPAGGKITLDWTMTRAKRIMRKGKPITDGDNWRNYPRQMLRARTISEGVRTVYPGVAVGVYTPEEAQDFEPVTVAQVNDDLPATPQPRKSSAQAKKDGDYERITTAMRACPDDMSLMAWGADHADEIGALPLKWQAEIRNEFADMRRAFKAEIADPNSVFIEPPADDATKAEWETYLDTILQAVMGSPSIAEVEDVQATNGAGIERLALLIEDAPDRIAAIAEQRIAELTAKAA